MVFVLVFLFGLFPCWASAQQAPSVILNEIAWMGSPESLVESSQSWRYEWLEFYNPAEQTVALDGWSIELYRGDELYFSIPLQGTIPPSGYFLLGASDKIPGVDVNYANLGGKFLNGGMKVVLKDARGDIIDELDARGGWPGGDNESKRTLERTQEGRQTSKEPGGTPRGENSAGFTEPTPELLLPQNKKDPSWSFLVQNLFSPVGLGAGVLALGSGFALLGLRRYLSRQS